MLVRIQNSKFAKALAIYLAINLMVTFTGGNALWALTSGPSQPEFTNFTPVGTSEMVNPFTGDFSYNIPLLSVGGYPINLAYDANVAMDQEASWVGLGWTLNPGVINRNLRGIPDDFKDDVITKEMNMNPNETYRINGTVGGEIFGIGSNGGGSLSFGVGIQYNTYAGIGVDNSINFGIAVGNSSKGTLTHGLGLTTSGDGLTISANVGYSKRISGNDMKNTNFGMGVGSSFNSRQGMKALNLYWDITKKDENYNVVESQNNMGDFKMGFETSYNSISTGMGSSIDFAATTYAPQLQMPLTTFGAVLSVKGGQSYFGVDGTYNIGAAYSKQWLNQKTQTKNSVGYLYAESGKNKIQDFNRENDGGFTLNTPALPITNLTYDVYNVSGQGVAGVYRPFQSSVGYVNDYRVHDNSTSASVGIELGGGNVVKAGVDVVVSKINTLSGNWRDQNDAADKVIFKDAGSQEDFERTYFKRVGEFVVDENSLLNNYGGEDAIQIELQDLGGLDVKATSTGLPQKNYRDERDRRNQVLSFLTAEEASNHGLDKQLVDANRKHHMGEVTILQPDGSRYIYGKPLYNNTQKEVTFNISGAGANQNQDPGISVPDCQTGLAEYNLDYKGTADNSVENKRGVDNYYSSTTLPAYAHSFLLTAVVSSDYVDLTGNGPTDDDLGSYTKFTYETGTGADFKWRVPIGTNTANYNQGQKSLRNDDQASYIYGEKEIQYLSKIETNNHIAIFDVALRADAHGVLGENGTIDYANDGTGSGKKLLKSIRLYTKPDYQKELDDVTGTYKATLLKKVNFEYNYSLCVGVQNNERYNTPAVTTDQNGFPNEGGKLTLTKVYFTYEDSQKGKLSPYEFAYEGLNPDYGFKDYDRWGNYMPNQGGCDFDEGLTNPEFPYVNQAKLTVSDPGYDANNPDKTFADYYAESWKLTKIKLPSGGDIHIEYESDDYAYVQNRKAMEMLKIVSLSDEGRLNDPLAYEPENAPLDVVVHSDLMTFSGLGIAHKNQNNMYLFFELPEVVEGIDVTDASIKMRNKYLNGIKDLYFRFMVNMTRSSGITGADNYEYVPGFCSFDEASSGVNASGSTTNGSNTIYKYGYIKLNTVDIGDREGSRNVNPIAKAAWQYGRLHTPQLVWNQPIIGQNTTVENIVKALWNSASTHQVLEAAQGLNGALMHKDFGKEVVLEKSWIRLLSASKKKKGGGHRVKQLTMSDNWGQMKGDVTGAEDFIYGQTYNYTTQETGGLISSGVASYEPLLGGDENPFKLPVAFSDRKEQRFLAADDDLYLLEPFGESFFPSPTVGYSKVTVKNLSHANVKRHATGTVVHEFYTAKDFPTITKRTKLEPMPKKTNPIVSLFSFKIEDYMTVSQGFYIELNDMHGKPKANWVYAEDQNDPISGIEYKYQSYGNQLSNQVQVIDKNGSIKNATVGVEYDVVPDFREQESTTITAGGAGNLAFFVVGSFPVTVPMFLPKYSKSKTRFRSAVITKVVRKYGVLKEVVAHDLGASVSTQNLAYDLNTGEVLVTKTVNNFDDPVYNLKYPSHWAYDRMGMAYKNIGVTIPDVSFSAGVSSTINSPQNYFVLGDEIMIGSQKGWVVDIFPGYNGAITVLGQNGQPITASSGAIKVIRSGRRNQQMIAIGGMMSKENPLNSVDFKNNIFEKVLTAQAVEFRENWQTFCDCPNDGSLIGNNNKYVNGTLGNWRAFKTYSYLTGREQTRENNNLDVRDDGTYTSYSPFWELNSSQSLWLPNRTNWTAPVEITKYSPYGMELENKDALGRYSSAIYGYNNTLPTSVSANSMYQESGFDGFEDYDYKNCNKDHFSFKQDESKLSVEEAHTGRYSIKLAPTEEIIMNKEVDNCNQ